MTPHRLYRDWLNHKKAVKISDHFTDSVMAKIHAGEKHSNPSFGKLYCSSLRFAKAALITAGVVGGLLRLAAIIGLILGTCVEAQGGIL